MIYAFEGLPAVGKSTTAQAIGGAYIIRETPKLFQRPKSARKDWYMDRHVARWEMALRKQQDCKHVVLDGDPFQPLWFNWIYQYQGYWESNEFVRQFYREQIVEDRIAFPDVYVYFHVDSDELLLRRRLRDQEEGEETIVSKFKKYLRMEAPLWNYFSTLAAAFPDRVKLLHSKTVEGNLEAIKAISPPPSKDSNLEMFELLVSFMNDYELEQPPESA